MGENYLYDFAIRSVKTKADGAGRFVVVFWSPTKAVYTELTGLSRPEAALMAQTIQARLALQWGAPAVEN